MSSSERGVVSGKSALWDSGEGSHGCSSRLSSSCSSQESPLPFGRPHSRHSLKSQLTPHPRESPSFTPRVLYLCLSRPHPLCSYILVFWPCPVVLVP